MDRDSEVRQATARNGCATRCTCIADAERLTHRGVGESCDYAAMRREVATRFLAGARSFDAADVIDCGIGWAGGDGGSDGGHSGNGDETE